MAYKLFSHVSCLGTQSRDQPRLVSVLMDTLHLTTMMITLQPILEHSLEVVLIQGDEEHDEHPQGHPQELEEQPHPLARVGVGPGEGNYSHVGVTFWYIKVVIPRL